MTVKKRKKLVHEGEYVSEVDVSVIQIESDWSPYVSVDDAHKLDDVQDALRRGDIEAASRLAKVYTLTPVAVQKDAHPIA